MEIPQRWGFCMAGNEQAFCDALDLAIKDSMLPASEDIPEGAGLREYLGAQIKAWYGKFIYFEIGIGNGDTMEAVHSWLTQRNLDHIIIGVDVPDYSGSASEHDAILINKSGAEGFLSNVGQAANFIFIDACHGAPCVTRDFLLAEKKVKPGGVICFHDIDQQCQGIHFQAHCGTGIDARRAVQELGLLDNARPGWKKVSETWGDKQKAGHGALFVQKI